FSDFLREARRGGDIADVHERGAAHRNDFERTDDRAGHLRTDLRDLRRRLAVDPGRIKLRIAQQLLVFDDLLAEPAALQKHVLRLQELLVRGRDAEKVIDGELVRILPFDLELNVRLVQWLGELAGQIRPQHHYQIGRASW